MKILTTMYSKLVPLEVRNKIRWIKNPVETWLNYIILKESKGRVLVGPFRETLYTEQHVAKVIGVYEKETHPFLSIIEKINFEYIYDIGAAGGYYLAGFCKMFPHAKIFAYEMLEEHWEGLREVALQNGGKDRVQIRGKFDLDHWSSHPENSQEYLIMMDVEGAELTLLDPLQMPLLHKAHILVEIHENRENNCASTIIERFALTHQISEVESQERAVQDFPLSLPWIVKKLFKRTILYVLSDQRLDKQKWLLLLPR